MRFAISTGVLLCLLTSSASAQMWGTAEALYFDRLSGDSTPLVTGQNPLSTASNYDAHSGYRIAIGGFVGDFEVEGILTNIEDLTASESGILAGGLSFDNQAIAGVAVPNRLAFQNALFNAATTPGTGNNDNERLEAEFLQAGATYVLQSTTDFRSGEVNFGTRRDQRNWRLGIGYRTVIVNDAASSLFTGTFDALDVDDGATPGLLNNDFNDGLSNAALTGAGFTNVFGAPDGFNSAVLGPDTVRLYSLGRARNELHGAQLTGAYSLFPFEWMTLELLGKAGLFYNTVNSSVLESVAGSVNDNSVYQRLLTGKDQAASFVGSVGLRTLLPITDYISFVAGYEMIFMGNIALGAEQFGGVQTNVIGQQAYSPAIGNSMTIHGGNFGLEITW